MKKNIRIAFILPSLANRGPVVFTAYLINALINKVENIDIYYFDDVKELDFDCNVYHIKNLRDIDFDKYDIVQTTMFRPDLYLSMMKYKFKKAKIIAGMHNYIFEDMRFTYGYIKGSIISFIWTTILKNFDGVIYSTNEMVKYYNKYIPNVPYSRIQYGISPVKFNNKKVDYSKEIEELKAKYTIIGAVGLLINRKGFHQIIQALQKLPDCALVLIGDGLELNSLQLLAKNYGVSERVIFTGFQHDSTEYYKYFDIYCLSSYSEGFGLAMIEALSAKLPLVCSKLDIYDEFFDENSVSFFDLDHIDSLCESINLIKCDMNKYSKASYQLYKDKFDVSVMADSHLEFYLDVLKK